MKILKLLLIGLVLLTAIQSFAQAQTETFDMMTFTLPKGWERNKFEDKIVLLKPDRSCAIVLFKSRESSGSGETDFKNEWKDRVAKQYNTTAEPKMQNPLGAEGGAGEVLMGAANIESNGAKSPVILTVYRGYGRAISVLGLNPIKCEEEIVDFMLKLEFGKAHRLR